MNQYESSVSRSTFFSCQDSNCMRLLSDMAIFLSEMPWPLNVSRQPLPAPSSFRTPKTNLFKQLNWPSLRWRRETASMTLFHKLLLTRPPPLGSCLFPSASTLSSRAMQKPHQLILPEAHTSKYINSFFYQSSLVWNTLPAAIQNITCNQTFKKEIEKNWSAHMHSTQFNPI